MSGKQKNRKHGDRVGVHLNQLIDDEFLALINKQTNLSGALLLGLLELGRKYGSVDLVDIIPRRFSLEPNHSIPLESRQSRFQSDFGPDQPYPGGQSNVELPTQQQAYPGMIQQNNVPPTQQQYADSGQPNAVYSQSQPYAGEQSNVELPAQQQAHPEMIQQNSYPPAQQQYVEQGQSNAGVGQSQPFVGGQPNAVSPMQNQPYSQMNQQNSVYPTQQQYAAPVQSNEIADMGQQNNLRPSQQMINNTATHNVGQETPQQYDDQNPQSNGQQGLQHAHNPSAVQNNSGQMNVVEPVQQYNPGMTHSNEIQQQAQQVAFNHNSEQSMSQHGTQSPVIRQTTYEERINNDKQSMLTPFEEQSSIKQPSSPTDAGIVSSDAEEDSGWNMEDFKSYSEASFYKKDK